MPSPTRVFPLVLLATTAFAANPLPGNYVGTLKFTRNPRSNFPLVTSVKAAAQVSEGGHLTIWLLTPPSLYPDATRETLQLTIGENGKCVVPKMPVPTPVVMGTEPMEPSPVEDEISLLRISMIPEFHGFVKVLPGGFSFSYDNAPDRFTNQNGDTVQLEFAVALIPTADFQFTFRKAATVAKPRVSGR